MCYYALQMTRSSKSLIVVNLPVEIFTAIDCNCTDKITTLGQSTPHRTRKWSSVLLRRKLISRRKELMTLTMTRRANLGSCRQEYQSWNPSWRILISIETRERIAEENSRKWRRSWRKNRLFCLNPSSSRNNSMLRKKTAKESRKVLRTCSVLFLPSWFLTRGLSWRKASRSRLPI